MQLDVFETLADPTRRRIVEVLRDGERQVGEVVEKAGIHQSGVSRHLRILFESGFVTVRPDGQRRFYGLRPEPFKELEDWVDRYRRLWDERLDRFGAALEKKTKARTKGKRT
jgi:DNA-binding transcriptional ArsR family regulator